MAKRKHDAAVITNALHMAVSQDYVECTDALIRAGVNVNAKNQDGRSPLISAVFYDAHNTATLLIQANCNLEERFYVPTIPSHNKYCTAFEYCFNTRNFKTAKCLALAGCRVDYARNKLDSGPLKTDDEELYHILVDVLSRPKHLRSICRFRIRNLIHESGKDIRDTVDTLQVPVFFKHYLKMTDIVL